MLANPFALLALLAYGSACLRLMLYRKEGARHRHHVSWIAWALLVVMGGSAIELMLNAKSIGLFESLRAALFSLLIFVARGNVARLLRSE